MVLGRTSLSASRTNKSRKNAPAVQPLWVVTLFTGLVVLLPSRRKTTAQIVGISRKLRTCFEIQTTDREAVHFTQDV